MSKQSHQNDQLVTITTDQLKNVSGGAGFDFMGMIGKVMPMIQQIGGLFKGLGGGGGQQG